MHVHIVYHGDIYSWILGKFAKNLRIELEKRGHTVSEGEMVNRASDVNHHITHYEIDATPGTVETRMVTHIDSIDKLSILKTQLANGSMGVCMSRETMVNLAAAGIPRQQLCFINPAHDSVFHPQPLVVGTSCRVHEDGRKREGFLEEIGRRVDPEEFSFRIMGEGWEPQVRALRSMGFQVEYTDHFSYDEHLATLSSLDYYLYTGMDEGQMGWLDAVVAGVKTIVTAQGFHLDADGGITHPYTTKEQLLEIFQRIQDERRTYRHSVEQWTWPMFAEKHLVVWDYLLSRQKGVHFTVPETPYKDGIRSVAEFGANADETRAANGRTFRRDLLLGYVRRKWNMKIRSFRKR